MRRRGAVLGVAGCCALSLSVASPALAQVIIPVQPIVPLPSAPPGPAEQDTIGSWTAVDGSINRQQPFAPSHTEVDPPQRRLPRVSRATAPPPA